MSFTESMTFAMIMAGIFFGVMTVDRVLDWIKPLLGVGLVHIDRRLNSDDADACPAPDKAEY